MSKRLSVHSGPPRHLLTSLVVDLALRAAWLRGGPPSCTTLGGPFTGQPFMEAKCLNKRATGIKALSERPSVAAWRKILVPHGHYSFKGNRSTSDIGTKIRGRSN